jgi:hypothetical protein
MHFNSPPAGYNFILLLQTLCLLAPFIGLEVNNNAGRGTQGARQQFGIENKGAVQVKISVSDNKGN